MIVWSFLIRSVVEISTIERCLAYLVKNLTPKPNEIIDSRQNYVIVITIKQEQKKNKHRTIQKLVKTNQKEPDFVSSHVSLDYKHFQFFAEFQNTAKFFHTFFFLV